MNAAFVNHSPPGLGLSLLIPRDLGRRAYWLHARFTVPAHPKTVWLDEAADEAGKLFIADMAKQGFTYIDKHGMGYRGPIPKTPITGAPSRLERERFVAKDALARVQQGDPMRTRELGYTATVPHIDESELWEYDLRAAFHHVTILTETPDPHEEFFLR